MNPRIRPNLGPNGLRVKHLTRPPPRFVQQGQKSGHGREDSVSVAESLFAKSDTFPATEVLARGFNP